MRVRVIQMINNFYKDGENNSLGTGANNDDVLGEYCCMGHFDALHIELVEWNENEEGESIRDKINATVVEKFKGLYNIRNVVCVTDSDAKDDTFWEEAAAMPYLFVSLVRIKHTDEGKFKKTSDLIKDFNELKNVMAYYTYDHSEIVVVRAGISYVQGFKAVLSMYENVNVLKMYSMFAVREKELERCETIQDEIIDCRLSAAIKSQENVGRYVGKLRDYLQEGNDLPEEFKIECYQTLGNSDCLIDISRVPIRKLLRCYKMGRLLTHTNELYGDAFFNVESQFLLNGDER